MDVLSVCTEDEGVKLVFHYSCVAELANALGMVLPAIANAESLNG